MGDFELDDADDYDEDMDVDAELDGAIGDDSGWELDPFERDDKVVMWDDEEYEFLEDEEVEPSYEQRYYVEDEE